MKGFAPSRAQKEIDAFWRSRVKNGTFSNHSYSPTEIMNLIARDINKPIKALSHTIGQDGTFHVCVDEDKCPKTNDSYDPYDQYRDSEGRLPPSMW